MKLLAFLAILPTFAQQALPIPSPFSIREEILRKGDAYNVATLMRQLKLPLKFEFEASAPGFDPSSLHAEVHPFSYGVYLLELCYEVNRYCRLIPFEGDSLGKPKESWRVRGYIDDFNWRGLHFDQMENWLVLTRHVGSGTGVAHYDRSWFKLESTGFQELLRNSYRGHRALTLEAAREWGVHFISEEWQDDSTSLTFLYYARQYTAGRESSTDVRRLVTFTRPNGSPKYHFNAARSELTESEIEIFITARHAPTAAAFRAFRNHRST